MKRRFAIGSLVLLTLAWLAYALLARPLAAQIARRWGPDILQAGDGKFSDVTLFLCNRGQEATWLLTLAIVAVWATVLLGGLLARRLPPLWKWTTHALVGFVAANLWLKFAMATCLFWCLFWNGKGSTNNLTQFQIKRLLINESPVPMRVILGGSSQAHAQIDPRQLNRLTAPNIATTELHFPGNHGNDFLFLLRDLEGRQSDVIVCYLSEMNFFAGSFSDGFSLFFKLTDLPQLLRLGAKPGWAPQAFGYGAFGSILPAFRLRDVAAQRFLGEETAGIKQRQQLADLAADPHQRAVEAARNYRAGPESEFEMAAFEAFVRECQAKHKTVVLCAGQLNPILGRELDPALRPQMLAYLNRLAGNYPNVVLLEEKHLPGQTPEDYDDLTHVNAAAQARFTEAISKVLLNLPKPAPAKAGA